jgi:hypothetical protein
MRGGHPCRRSIGVSIGASPLLRHHSPHGFASPIRQDRGHGSAAPYRQPTRHPPPLKLTARPRDRGPFLQAVAARLAEDPDLLGDGHIARVAIEVQRRFWSPPAVDGSGHRAGVGTYAR